jgi:hypothetical protein
MKQEEVMEREIVFVGGLDGIALHWVALDGTRYHRD